MRGRGDSTGAPDLQRLGTAGRRGRGGVRQAPVSPTVSLDPDLVTLRGRQRRRRQRLRPPRQIPRLLCRAQSECGISDYAIWHRRRHMGSSATSLKTRAGSAATPTATRGLSQPGRPDHRRQPAHSSRDLPWRDGHPRALRAFAALCRRGATIWARGILVTYHEFKGVGTRSHYGNMTPEQETFRKDASKHSWRAGTAYRHPAPRHLCRRRLS